MCCKLLKVQENKKKKPRFSGLLPFLSHSGRALCGHPLRLKYLQTVFLSAYFITEAEIPAYNRVVPVYSQYCCRAEVLHQGAKWGPSRAPLKRGSSTQVLKRVNTGRATYSNHTGEYTLLLRRSLTTWTTSFCLF